MRPNIKQRTCAKPMAEVDVIIPCYNYGHFLRESVMSVLCQTNVEVRVLVIDDASADDTCEIARCLCREDSRVTFLHHSSNRGHIATYNEGIEWASAEYYMILSADDYLLPGALYRSSSIMREHENVTFVFGDAVGYPAPPSWLLEHAKYSPLINGLDFIKRSGSKNLVPTPSALVRTKIQKAVGGYRQELPHSGDMELWLRLAIRGLVGFVSEKQAFYRRHSDNMSTGYAKAYWLEDLKQRRAAFELFFEAERCSIGDREDVRRILLKSLAIDAVAAASAAFNDGEIKLSHVLSDFALNQFPAIPQSVQWLRLSWKRRVGLRAWRLIQGSRAMFLRARA